MNMRRNGRIVSAFVVAACALTCTASFAGTKVKIIYTAAPPYLASFVAQDQGFFAKNGLDVVLELVANGSVITQSLVSGGAEIGGPTATVLLQADEAGLDMVALAAAEKFPTPYRLGLLAREGSNVASPASLAGKTIGVPGLNGVIDVMVRKFLAANGVDEKKVKRVELAFAQMGDALKSGQVDVVAIADPFFSRIVDSKLGYPAGAFADVVPAGTVAAVYAATRNWTVAHADAVKAFRQSLSEATEFIRERTHDDAVRQSLAKYTKLPPQVAGTLVYPTALEPDLTPENLQFWIDVAKEQGMIAKKVDARSLIAP
jgi:NitT/TauT family transport system substrate-binding protein